MYVQNFKLNQTRSEKHTEIVFVKLHTLLFQVLLSLALVALTEGFFIDPFGSYGSYGSHFGGGFGGGFHGLGGLGGFGSLGYGGYVSQYLHTHF